MKKLTYIISGGEHKGKTTLYPHLNKEGFYVVSKTRFAEDQKYLKTIDEVCEYLAKGYNLRMSNKEEGRAPSLIIPDHIEGWR